MINDALDEPLNRFASYRFDEAGMHRRGALDSAFASFAVDTRVGAIHVAGQQWETVYQPAYSDTFLAATLTTTGIGAAANASASDTPKSTNSSLSAWTTQSPRRSQPSRSRR